MTVHFNLSFNTFGMGGFSLFPETLKRRLRLKWRRDYGDPLILEQENCEIMRQVVVAHQDLRGQTTAELQGFKRIGAEKIALGIVIVPGR